jgi:cytochrome c556
MSTEGARTMQSHGRMNRSRAARLTTALAVTAAAVTCASVTIAQNQSAAETVKSRQQGLKSLGAAFKLIRDELRSESPDAAKIRAAAADITHAAGAIGIWFPAGTGPESGVKTDAKPEVWTDAAGFAAARTAFVREADKWAQLSNSADRSAWKDAAASLGQSCKGCHDKYRVKKE